MKRLPGRIALVMLGTILLFVLTVGAAVLSLTRALDEEARTNTERQVRRALDDLLLRTEEMAYDYAKWGEGVERAGQGDVGWFDNSYGSSAILGKSMQVLMIWGGAFGPEGRGWIEGGRPEGRSDLIHPLIMARIDAALAHVPVGSYDGTAFFAWNLGQLYAFAGSRLEHPLDLPQTGPQPAVPAPRLALGRRLDAMTLSGIAEDFGLERLRVMGQAPRGLPSVPLPGPGGQPIATLVWDPPSPGSDSLRRMALPLAAVLAGVVGLAGLGMALVRRNAKDLLRAERIACIAAHTDPLTGLPNRAAFNEALARPAAAGERAVLFLDVNDFKRINDSLGHEAGDQVILDLARRLGALAGPATFLARIAGDEFVFIVAGTAAEERALLLAQDARRALGPPVRVQGHELRVDMSMGYAVQGSGPGSGPDLVRQADLAMYEAKRDKRRGRIVAFGAVIEQAARDAERIERGLRRALEAEGELAIAWQPILDLDGRLARAEALARWRSPELGPVPPDRFIRVAEQAGLIVPLGRRLLDLAARDLAAHPGLCGSVNVSTLQLMAPDFLASLTGTLAAHGVAAARVEVELTEAMLVDDAGLAADRLRELRAAGVSTALDDFGTGYSSVGYLERLGFDTLKVDRTLVARLSDAGGTEVLRGVVILAHGLGMRVVCEGVESEEDLARLRALGCDLVQGFHLGRPLPLADFASRWLAPASGPVAAVA